ncbi:MAG: hypothetical protein ACHQDE_07585 [Acidimicrobiia bacterium]
MPATNGHSLRGSSNDMANQMGKRYVCGECEATVLVTKAGDGELSCHGKAMTIATAKPLPSSD